MGGGPTQQRLVGTDAAAHKEAAGDAALDENTRRHRGSLRPPDLDQDKGDQEHESEHKQRDDAPVAPLDAVSSAGPGSGRGAAEGGAGLNTYTIREAAPLQSQAQADHSGEEGG